MQTPYARALAVGVAVAIVLGGCGSGKPLSGTITGVQAPASQPLVRAWGLSFEQASGAHVRVPVGDVARFASGAAAFAVSDEPPTPATGGAKGAVVGVPIAVSPVAIAYNIVTFAGKRVGSGVWLDGDALAAVY